MGRTKKQINWSNPLTTAENEVLPRYFKWAWMSRGLSLGMSAILVMRLTYFLTDMVGMSAVLVGTILLASKIFDGITDLVAGILIDRTSTKFGKARPYEFCIVLVWVFIIFMFSMPELGRVGQIVYVFIMYALINSVFTTLLNAGEPVYLARSVRNGQNRISVMSFNGTVIMICSIVLSILMPQLLAGVGSTRAGWAIMALSFGIPMAIIGMLRFVFVKEVAVTVQNPSDNKKEEHVSIKVSLKALVQNKYIFILAGMGLVTQLIANMTASTDYYSKYVLGNVGMGSILSLANIFTPIVLMLFPFLSKKLGSTNIIRLGAAISVTGYLLRIIGGTNMIALIFGSLLSGIGMVPVTMMGAIYVIDCMSYSEWKSGVRIDGVTNSVYTFCTKLGSGLASGLVGIVMGIAGYNGSLAVQSAGAITAIHIVFNWIPLAGMLILLLLAFIYGLEKKMPTIRADLEKRQQSKTDK